MKNRGCYAQTLAEYAICFTVAVAAIFTVSLYVRRGMQGRYKDASDYAIAEISAATGNSTYLKQYDPYYQEGISSSTFSTQSGENMQTGGSVTYTTDDSTTQEAWKRMGLEHVE